MATAHLIDDQLLVRFSTAEKVGGVLRDIVVPLSAVRAAQVAPDGLKAATGIRAPGLSVPGYNKIGTWRGRGRGRLVVVRRGRPALTVELRGHRYTDLLIDVDDAEELARTLSAVAPRSTSREVSVELHSGGATLAGTLTLPERPGPHPAALLLPGSGPVDRNSNHRRLKLDVTRQLAKDLAGVGIASLRCDKRGVGASSGRWLAAGFIDNIDDAAAALGALRDRSEVDSRKVIAVGHSEGALLAASAAARGADVAGVVLLSPSATPGEELLRWQARQIAPTLPAVVKLLLRVLRVDLVAKVRSSHAKIKATSGDVARIGGRRINARWHREFLAHDPRPDLARIRVPVLAISGTEDLQVKPGDLAVITALVQGPVQTQLVTDLTHVLRRQTGEPSLGAYRSEIRQPVDAEVRQAVTAWAASLLHAEAPGNA